MDEKREFHELTAACLDLRERGIFLVYPRSALVRYGIAVLAALLAILVRAMLTQALDEEAATLVFTLAVACVGLWGGLGPGILTTAMGALVGWAEIVSFPIHAIALPGRVDSVHLLVFVLIGLGTSFIAGGLRRSLLRERAQRLAIYAANARLKAVFDHAPLAIVALRADGTVSHWNKFAEKIFGWKETEVLGRYVPFVSEGKRQEADSLRSRIIAGDAVVDVEIERHRRDGSPVLLSVSSGPLYDPAGELTGVIAIAEDISERRRVEQVMNERVDLEGRLAKIAATAPGAIHTFRLKPDGSVSFPYASPAIQDIYGIAPEKLIEDASAAIQRIHPDDVARVMKDTEDSAHTLLPWLAEFRVIHPQKGEIWVEGNSRPEIKDDGTILWHGFLNDITERKRVHEELRAHRDNLSRLVDERTEEMRKARDAAEAGNRAKSEFLANMSHELRTPMHAIIAYTRLGLEKIADGDASRDKLSHYLSRIDQGAARLLSLLNNLLDLAKLESGRTDYNFEDANLMEIVRLAVEEFQAYALSRRIVIVVHAQPVQSVYCDRPSVGQVVRNLLTNAIKFTPEGKTVHVRFKMDSMPTGAKVIGDEVNAVRLSVEDDGIGMPVDELETVFDKFVQSSKTKTGSGGTGLGLSICREIVTAHDGLIWAENNSNGGASFHVVIPCDRNAISLSRDVRTG